MNHKTNKAFLLALDKSTRQFILGVIAAEYECTTEFAFDSVTDEEAEHLLDYLSGSTRAATSVLMRRHGFAV